MEIRIRTISKVLDQRAGSTKLVKKYQRSLARGVKKHRKKMIRFGLLGANLALLVGVISFVANNPGSGQAVRQNALSGDTMAANPLDQLSSSDIAVHLANMASLPESVAIANQADTISVQMAVSSADNTIVAKPQVVNTDSKSYLDIEKYIVKPGDTFASLAAKFGVTSDSIRWSNDLGSSLPVGRTIYIPPVTGIVYVVKPGDTPEKLAQDFSANKDAIISFNDAELSGLRVGRRIVIPDGIKREAFAVGSFAASRPYSGWSASYGANGYDYGWCTWHAANRRAQIGRPIPSNMGNAISWLGASQAAGLSNGSRPQAGAVVYHLNIGGWGHVAFVEKINPDGSALVSDMNYPIWGSVTHRTISPSEFGNYRFIY